jgi:phosphoribosylformylglycinamidine (FGAM) synthase-like enzyme
VPDVRRSTTMDLKEPGNLIYLAGLTKHELLGAHYEYGAGASSVPMVDLETAPRLMAALHAAIAQGLVRACHDLSEGGLGVAAAEMAFAGGLGLRLDLREVPRAPGVDADDTALFAESASRLLAEVRPQDAAAFEALLAGLPYARVGSVTEAPELVVAGLGGGEALRAGIGELRVAWQATQVV